MRGHIALAVTMLVVAACSRGPAPPAPREELFPNVIGVIGDRASAPPVTLLGDTTFAPPEGAAVDRVKNWPGGDVEPDCVCPGDLLLGGQRSDDLLLGGQRSDGSWWYELATFSEAEGCWVIMGGSFDRSDSVQFSSGLVVHKAPGFNIRGDSDLEPVDEVGFPGHELDYICLDREGHAQFFVLFQPR